MVNVERELIRVVPAEPMVLWSDGEAPLKLNAYSHLHSQRSWPFLLKSVCSCKTRYRRTFGGHGPWSTLDPPVSWMRLPFNQRQTTRVCVYDLDLDLMTLMLDVDILKMYLHTKMKFVGQGFQKLEIEQDSLTVTDTPVMESDRRITGLLGQQFGPGWIGSWVTVLKP